MTKDKSSKIIIPILFIFFSLIASSSFAFETIIIANKSVSLDKISRDDIRDIFLGKKTKWSDGSNIKFYLLKRTSDQEKFLSEYLRKTPAEYEHFWMQKVFTGKGLMPEMVEGYKNMVDAVSKTEGSLGFLSDAVPIDQVKIMVVE